MPTPSEMKIRVSARCPRCGKELGAPDVNDIFIFRAGGVKVVKKK